MKKCDCEHWETCTICYPQGFDEQGNRKPVEIPLTREELQAKVAELEEKLSIEIIHREGMHRHREEFAAKLNRANAVIEKCKSTIKQMLHAERMSCRPPETVQQAERKLDAIRWAATDAEEALAAIAEYQTPKGGE